MLARIGILCIAVAASSAASARTGGTGNCPPLSSAAKLPRWPSGGTLHGDVDGDGRRDRASIHFARRAPAGCAFFVVVQTRTRTLAVRVSERYTSPLQPGPLGEPYVAFIVRLAANRSQIVVALWHGASVAIVNLYGLVNRKLLLLRFPPPRFDILTLFGSVGTGTTSARCRRGGAAHSHGRRPLNSSGKQWGFTQALYRLKGSRFRSTERRSVVVPQSRRARVARRWGAWSRPFSGCVVARGKRL